MNTPKSRRSVSQHRFPRNVMPGHIVFDTGREFVSQPLPAENTETTSRSLWSLVDFERALLQSIREFNRKPAPAPARGK